MHQDMLSFKECVFVYTELVQMLVVLITLDFLDSSQKV